MGGISGLDPAFLEEDFDPAKHDQVLAQMFESGSDDGVLEKPEFDVHDDDDWFAAKGIEVDDDDDGAGASGGGEGGEEGPRDSAKFRAKKRKRTEKVEELETLYNELFDLDFEDMAGGQNVKFKYREVQPESFGMTITDILALSDAELNSVVGLKKLAPYRDDVKPAKYTKKFAKFMKKHAEKNPDSVVPRTEEDHTELERIQGAWKRVDLRKTKARLAKGDKKKKEKKKKEKQGPPRPRSGG